MFAEDISEDISEDRRYHIYWILKYFLDIFEIFAEDCFLLRSFRKFLPSGFLPLSRFQKGGRRQHKMVTTIWCRFDCPWLKVFKEHFITKKCHQSLEGDLKLVRGLSGTGPPDPTLESTSPSPPQGRFGVEIRSNQESMSNQCRIDVKSMRNRPLTRARRGGFEGGVGGGLCLISPSQP